MSSKSGKKSSGGTVVLLLLGIILGGTSGYVLNWLYPFESIAGPSPFTEPPEYVINNVTNTYVNNTYNTQSGLLQSETVESSVSASIDGTDTVETLVPEMALNVTIQNGSAVEMMFTAPYFISMYANYQYGVEFNVSILVDGVAIMTVFIFAYRTSQLTETEYESGIVSMNYMHTSLSAGEHTFEVVYSSRLNKNDCAFHFRPTGYNFIRYFTISEWRSE